MSFKDFLNQWWILKEVKRKDGKRERDEVIYQNKQPFCFGLYLQYWPQGVTTLHFDYFIIDDMCVRDYFWRTSAIEQIKEIDKEITFITKNTVYTFEKTDSNPLEPIPHTGMN